MKPEKILQIIPAPTNMYAMFEGDGKTGSAYPVACLALVQRSDGSRDVEPMIADGSCIEFAETSEDYIGVTLDER